MSGPFEPAAQLTLLGTIYAGLRELGAWPTTAYVDSLLAHEHGLDFQEVLAGMPAGTVTAGGGYSENSRIQASFEALAEVPEAQGDLERYVALVAFAAERERQQRPGPAEGSEVRLDQRDEAAIWPQGPEAQEIALALVIAGLEPLFTSLGARNPDGTWSITFDRGVRRYHGVHDVRSYLERRPQPPAPAWSPPPAVEPYVFVLMPFGPQWSSAVKLAIDAACAEVARQFPGVRWERADEITVPGRITAQIVSAIERADVLIADITATNPNVMFELGYADALQKPIIVLNQDLEQTPFDIKDWRQIPYSLADVGMLSGTLSDFVSGTLRRLGFAAS